MVPRAIYVGWGVNREDVIGSRCGVSASDTALLGSEPDPVLSQDISVSENPIRVLVQDDSGRYWLQSAGGNKITPSGSYDFVTMPDGTIRVARPNNTWDFSTHLGLSGGGEVNWAGSIRFGNNMGPNRGTILEWTNNSGHYQPPAYLRGNAGLPDGLFRPH